MATLLNPRLGTTIVLRSHHTFGRRQSSVDTWLESPDVSQIHAAIRWEGLYWAILDLSRNGTWVDDQPLTYGQSTRLQVGMTIKFGDSQEATWRVADVEPPKTVLISLNNHHPDIELDMFYSLPNERQPEISLYLSEWGQWLCERADGVTPLRDGDVISYGQQQWKLCCAEPIEATPNHFEPSRDVADDIAFHFDVSLDEEHILLKLIQGRATFDLGERAHHALLLTLARHRLHDMQHQIDVNEQGWIDLEVLSHMLNIDPPHMNIHIHRARKQIAKFNLNLSYLPQVVERRVGSIRFGCPKFTIAQGVQDNAMAMHAVEIPGARCPRLATRSEVDHGGMGQRGDLV